MTDGHRTCTRCVMDTTAANITFDADGVCSYCTDFLRRSGGLLSKDPALLQRDRDAFVARVKKQGEGKRYDCVVGVSGGVDSSWVLVQAVKAGLRPLAVHMDNGWNSELAQSNISNLVRPLEVDLYTHVIDWNEYRKLMQAFFDADVIDVELLYDNAMLAVNYQQAARHGIKYILGGTNQATEGMYTPRNWNWFKYDKKNIRALGRRGGTRLDTFPVIGTLDYVWYQFVRGIRWISYLDYLPYNKAAVLEQLQREYQYKPYPYKHYESIFTRFYQGYLLREKFGVDKRRLHLGTLVAAGQMSRDDAVRSIEGLAYPSQGALDDDVRYFLKKMGWTAEQLSDYLRRPERSHAEFGTERGRWELLSRIYFAMKGGRPA